MKSLYLLLVLLIFSCRPDIVIDEPSTESYYFPSNTSDSWETLSPDSLAWNSDALQELCDFMEENSTRGFMILQDGKIVVEKYWGEKITTLGDFDKDSQWYWASAGKTLTAAAVGVAQQKGELEITDKTSDYLGNGWTSMDQEKEDLITIHNQLSMTTGMDYNVDLTCVDPSCLIYNVDAGEQWFYHNGPYTLLQSVVTNATGMEFSDYLQQEILTKIGASGTWVDSGNNKVFYSTVRDAARFGSLVLNEGKWDGVTILQDSLYFSEMTNTSQEINLSYGYLWWLNGKNSIVYPGFETVLPISLAPNAPDDLIAAMGKNGQMIDVVPSKNMVVVRMGEESNNDVVPVQLHNDMWDLIQNL